MNEQQVGEITELEALEINVALFWELDLILFDLLLPLTRPSEVLTYFSMIIFTSCSVQGSIWVVGRLERARQSMNPPGGGNIPSKFRLAKCTSEASVARSDGYVHGLARHRGRRAFEFKKTLRNSDLSFLRVRRFSWDSGLNKCPSTVHSVQRQALRAYQAQENYEVEKRLVNEDLR